MSDLPGGQSKTLLVGYINRIKAEADEIRDRQAAITDICRDAKAAGFEPSKMREVVRWLQKIDKHGRDKVDEAEAIFDLYRSVAAGQPVKLDEIMDTARDRALLAMFAPQDQTEQQLSRRRKGMRTALAMAQAAKQARTS